MIRPSKRIQRIVLTVFALVSILLLTCLWYSGVDNSLTDEDAQFIPKYTTSMQLAFPNSSYEEQIAFFRAVQNSVLTVAPENTGLPQGGPREPKDLYLAKVGLCFDRSRVIEKILEFYGFRTRHIFIYSKKTKGALMAFLTPGVPSHAVTEAETPRGWLVIDSNDRWISLDQNGDPRGMADIQRSMLGTETIPWAATPPPIYADLAPSVFVYGLYSRHGRFYPPYNPIPDVNYRELLANF